MAFASLFADISTEMLYPVLPIFLTQTLNAGGSVVGLVEGVAQATQNIVQGFSGALSDKLQKRKPIALAGYLLAAIAKPLIGLSTVWQGVLGAQKKIMETIIPTIVECLTPKQRKEAWLGLEARGAEP